MSVDPAWLAQRYTTDQAPVDTIAEEAGVNPATIYRAITAHGIPHRGRLDAGWAATFTKRELRVRLGQGQTGVDIAGEYGCSAQTVLEHVHRHGLGHLLTRTTEPPAQAEIDRCVALHREGRTRAQIAQIVGIGVRTVTRRLSTGGVKGRAGRPAHRRASPDR